MSKLFQFILCCCVVGLSYCKSEAEIKQYFMKLGVECSKDISITSDDMVMLQKHKMPDSENARCLMACVYKKATWMDSKGMFDAAAAVAVAEKEHGDDTTMVENSKKLFDQCKSVNDETVKDGEKGCERAVFLFKCLTENAAKGDQKYLNVHSNALVIEACSDCYEHLVRFDISDGGCTCSFE